LDSTGASYADTGWSAMAHQRQYTPASIWTAHVGQHEVPQSWQAPPGIA
jgi:hypothetical protein